MGSVRLTNWKQEIIYHANSLEVVNSIDDIVRIVKDTARYPSPVRGKGSHHSTTKCIVAEGGTVIDVTKMNKILDIDTENKTVTMQAGVLHIDAARELEKHGLQLYVNIELGNMTVGAAANCCTKDASYFNTDDQAWEFGQASSYAIGFKAVGPDGELFEVTEDDPELLEMMRTSHGMLGVTYEVTLRVKPIKPMAVEHVLYTLDEFADNLEQLVAGNRSMMLYLFPFQDNLVVEYRHDGLEPIVSHAWQWRLRNFVWGKFGPGVAKVLSTCVPFRGLRYAILDAYHRVIKVITLRLIRGTNTSPADQIIRYPKVRGFDAYTFSIWAFPREEYPQAIRDYFAFCKDYYAKNGYRTDMLNVGYHIAQDRQSIFSYTRRGPVLTLDPVSTGGLGWQGFLTAYNEFCIEHNGTFLMNQTPGVTPLQAKAAFGPEIKRFLELRRRRDPNDRFYNDYFRHLFE